MSKSLVFDRRDELGSDPGTHALIVGISEYPSLPPHESPNPQAGGSIDPTFGLTKQKIAADSAHSLYEWLLKNRERLSVPLATCRVLLAPSEEEIGRTPGLGDFRSNGTVDEFVDLANAWRTDAASRSENMTLFYFAGNGFEIERADPILAFSDFGSGVGPVLRSTIRVDDLFRGMGPAEWQPDIARTQLYFIDTDRDPVQAPPAMLRRGTTLPFDIGLKGLDERSAVVFFASSPGGSAYGFVNGRTLLVASLVRCLDGRAAVSAGIGPDGSQRWHVTTTSLANTLGSTIEAITRRASELTGEEIKQEVTLSGLIREAEICRLDGPPLVPYELVIEPAEAIPHVQVEFFDDQDQAAQPTSSTSSLKGKLPAGVYRIKVSFGPGGSSYTPTQFIQWLIPPKVLRKVRVAP